MKNAITTSLLVTALIIGTVTINSTVQAGPVKVGAPVETLGTASVKAHVYSGMENRLTLAFDAPVETKATIRIYDSNHNLVHHARIFTAKARKNFKIDHMDAGNYTFELTTAGGGKMVFPFVKE